MDEHLVSGTKILVSEGNYFLLSITIAVLAVLISLGNYNKSIIITSY